MDGNNGKNGKWYLLICSLPPTRAMVAIRLRLEFQWYKEFCVAKGLLQDDKLLIKRCGEITGKYLSNNVVFLPLNTIPRLQKMEQRYHISAKAAVAETAKQHVVLQTLTSLLFSFFSICSINTIISSLILKLHCITESCYRSFLISLSFFRRWFICVSQTNIASRPISSQPCRS